MVLENRVENRNFFNLATNLRSEGFEKPQGFKNDPQTVKNENNAKVGVVYSIKIYHTGSASGFTRIINSRAVGLDL